MSNINGSDHSKMEIEVNDKTNINQIVIETSDESMSESDYNEEDSDDYIDDQSGQSDSEREEDLKNFYIQPDTTDGTTNFVNDLDLEIDNSKHSILNGEEKLIKKNRFKRLMNTDVFTLLMEKREFKYYCKIPKNYLSDDFNLTGIAQHVRNYSLLCRLLVGTLRLKDLDKKHIFDIIEDDNYDQNTPVKLYHLEIVLHRVFKLYGAIHMRYVITKDGLDQIAEKYDNKLYGPCPRYYCSEVQLLPCGLSDFPKTSICKLYCPSCLDLYEITPNLHPILDGSFFGTSFVGIFLNNFTELDKYVAKKKQGIINESLKQKSLLLEQDPNMFIPYDDILVSKPGLKHTLQNFQYEPKIFGFRINQNSEIGPSMKWLRHWPVSDEQKKEFELCERGIPK
ncbi:casein kinase II beta subunit [Hanseniaspora valbyensis NRRL Y-1626]|uniref:Casein kinase II subunit beta n=1 Tax=Hanseniaspora valbyensis NRRL Y-1626 TaxID=766949 RepID=A0A1B7TGM9_9ASCO|nr:casein kinase II beta subunit [Hanseniaspora valbyensis NRRL Y-1626]